MLNQFFFAENGCHRFVYKDVVWCNILKRFGAEFSSITLLSHGEIQVDLSNTSKGVIKERT